MLPYLTPGNTGSQADQACRDAMSWRLSGSYAALLLNNDESGHLPYGFKAGDDARFFIGRRIAIEYAMTTNVTDDDIEQILSVVFLPIAALSRSATFSFLSRHREKITGRLTLRGSINYIKRRMEKKRCAVSGPRRAGVPTGSVFEDARRKVDEGRQYYMRHVRTHSLISPQARETALPPMGPRLLADWHLPMQKYRIATSKKF